MASFLQVLIHFPIVQCEKSFYIQRLKSKIVDNFKSKRGWRNCWLVAIIFEKFQAFEKDFPESLLVFLIFVVKLQKRYAVFSFLISKNLCLLRFQMNIVLKLELAIIRTNYDVIPKLISWLVAIILPIRLIRHILACNHSLFQFFSEMYHIRIFFFEIICELSWNWLKSIFQYDNFLIFNVWYPWCLYFWSENTRPFVFKIRKSQ